MLDKPQERPPPPRQALSFIIGLEHITASPKLQPYHKYASTACRPCVEVASSFEPL